MPQPSSLGLFVMLCFNTHIYKEFNSLNEGAGLLKQRLEWPKQSHVHGVWVLSYFSLSVALNYCVIWTYHFTVACEITGMKYMSIIMAH